MRIDNGNKLPPAHLLERSLKSGTQRVGEKSENPTGDLSAISDLAAQAGAVSGASEARLEALRAAVESGSYHVSSSALAESIIDSHLKP